MASIFKNAPKTEEGKKLNLSKEDEEKYIIVYRINQESWQLEIVEPWDTEKEYDNMCVLMPLTSSYEDVVLLSSGTYVRNVVGSSGDTNPYGNCSWLGIIKLVYDVKGISAATPDIQTFHRTYQHVTLRGLAQALAALALQNGTSRAKAHKTVSRGVVGADTVRGSYPNVAAPVGGQRHNPVVAKATL